MTVPAELTDASARNNHKGGLTLRQRRFVEEVQVDWNFTQAAIRAGYSPQSARHQGSELMAMEKIRTALSEGWEERQKRMVVDKRFVMAKLLDNLIHAEKLEGASRVDRVNRCLDLIGRHVDVDAFRQHGFRAGDDGPSDNWDLSRLDDAELETFERLLRKITLGGDEASADAGGHSGGTDETPFGD